MESPISDISRHVAGIGHPLLSDPPGHNKLFSGQFDTVKGQKAWHSFPSKPIGPISKNHCLTQINLIITEWTINDVLSSSMLLELI